ncbi:MAG: hypothetical protein IM536_18565 [Pseudanabaena sp. M34BS1SP1A06MG]|nr:hypothetical protein [Pseudanabaena sp. M34BS1SP1A06MG]
MSPLYEGHKFLEQEVACHLKNRYLPEYCPMERDCQSRNYTRNGDRRDYG